MAPRVVIILITEIGHQTQKYGRPWIVIHEIDFQWPFNPIVRVSNRIRKRDYLQIGCSILYKLIHSRISMWFRNNTCNLFHWFIFIILGEFWMSYNDFLRTFTHIEAVHLDADTARDEPSLIGKMPWILRLYHGRWQKGVTAGGCRNNPGKIYSVSWY